MGEREEERERRDREDEIGGWWMGEREEERGRDGQRERSPCCNKQTDRAEQTLT